MAKLKKNYSINSAAVELLDELAEALNLKQGDFIAGLVCAYGVKHYEDIVRSRYEDENRLQYFSHLRDCALYELIGEEEAVDGAE